METSIFQIEFKDGSIFRIFCANKAQKNRVTKLYNSMRYSIKEFNELVNGIHTCKEFEQIVKSK